jgi:uncharacterized membrane protein
MKLSYYRILLTAIAIIGTFLLIFPTLSLIIRVPQTESVSELWLLGPEHMAYNYPFDIRSGENHSIYLGVGNRQGSSARYSVLVKLRNQTEPSPVNSTSSSLDPVYAYGFFVPNDDVLEKRIAFSFSNISFENGGCTVQGLSVDGHTYAVDKVLTWDSEKKGFYCQLFFELYLYDKNILGFQYDSRFVALWLNVTSQPMA